MLARQAARRCCCCWLSASEAGAWGGLMQQGRGLIHSPSSCAKTSKDALKESKSPSPAVQALQNLCRTFLSSSVHRSYSASSFMYRLPHWLRYKRFMNTEGLISVSHSSIWRGVFLFEERTFFSRLYSSHFISLSSFPYHFSSLSHTYLSLNITLLTCSYFAQKVTVISSFESPPPFFFFFSVLIVHLWIIQIADSEFETCSWLPGGNWRWTLQTTSLSQIWMNAAALVCLDSIKEKATRVDLCVCMVAAWVNAFQAWVAVIV